MGSPMRTYLLRDDAATVTPGVVLPRTTGALWAMGCRIRFCPSSTPHASRPTKARLAAATRPPDPPAPHRQTRRRFARRSPDLGPARRFSLSTAIAFPGGAPLADQRTKRDTASARGFGAFADSLYAEATVSIKDEYLEMARGEQHDALEYWNASNVQ